MTCHDAREQFSALVDDALTPRERAALDAHLATCADCRRELQRFRDTVAMLRAVEPLRAPAGFVDHLLEATRPDPWYRRLLRGLFLPWPIKLPMEAAAIVLVGIGVALVYRATLDTRQFAVGVSGERPAAESPVTESLGRRAAAPARELSARRDLPPTGEQDKPGEQSKLKDQAPGLAETYQAKEAPEPPKSPATIAPRSLDAAVEKKHEERGETQAAKQAAKTDAADATRAALERARTSSEAENLQSRPAPASPRSQADAPPGARAAPPVAALRFAPPTVSGRLIVSDVDAALRGLAEVVTRLGVVENGRADASGGQIVELSVSRDAYPELTRELARLGRWQPSKEPAELPAQLRVVLQITRGSPRRRRRNFRRSLRSNSIAADIRKTGGTTS